GGGRALEADDAAGFGERAGGGTNDVLVGAPLHVFQIFAVRLAGDRHAVAVENAGVEQRLQQHRHPACLAHGAGDVFAAGLEVGEVGRLAHDVDAVVHGEADAALVRHGRKVQAAIGGAAGGGDDDGRVLE